LPGTAGRLVHHQLHRAADHQGGELVLGHRGVRVADDLAVPDHGDPVGDRLDLLELVRDEHDALAGRAQRVDDLEQVLDLLRGQHRGRLVQDQRLRVPDQGLDDLHPLLHADREVLDLGVRVHREAVALGDLPHLGPGRAAVEHLDRTRGRAERRLVAQDNVFHDREDGHEHEVLVHHADAGRDRVPRAADRPGHPVHEDLALVRLVEPVQHVHQRRLAGAVLAEKTVDLPGFHGQVDVVVGHQRTEPLGDGA
jgi:hypothetical protein